MFCGRVTSEKTKVGINAVMILDSKTKQPLAVTDYLGKFSIPKEYAPFSIIINSPTHFANNDVIELSDNITIGVSDVTTPVFVLEPENSEAIINNSITLSCEAKASPSPYQFIWYKDGVEFKVFKSISGHDITVSSDVVSSNVYHCVAFSNHSNIASNKAVIKFEENKLSCSAVIENWVKLPLGYNMKNSGVTEIDVGSCGAVDPCVPKVKNISTGYCCQADDVETLYAINSKTDDVMHVHKVKSCACMKCPPASSFLLKGRVDEFSDSVGDFNNTWIMYNGVRHEIKDDLFEFFVIASAGNVVYEVKSRDYMPNLVSVSSENPEVRVKYKHHPGFVKVLESIAYLVRKPKGQMFETIVGGEFNVKSSHHLTAAITINIEPNSIVDEKGDLYKGKAKILTIHADIRNGIDALDAVPGKFRTLDKDGFYRTMRTNGVLTIIVETLEGDRLIIAKPYIMHLDPVALKLDENKAATSMYSLDKTTGSWNFVGKIVNKNKRLRREITTIPFKVLKSDDTYFSLETTFHVCYVAVDLKHTKDGKDIPCPGQKIKAVSMNCNNSILLATHTTNEKGRACLTMLCDIYIIAMVKPLSKKHIFIPNAKHIHEAQAYDYQLINDTHPRILLRTRPGPLMAVSETIEQCLKKVHYYEFRHNDLPTYDP